MSSSLPRAKWIVSPSQLDGPPGATSAVHPTGLPRIADVCQRAAGGGRLDRQRHREPHVFRPFLVRFELRPGIEPADADRYHFLLRMLRYVGGIVVTAEAKQLALFEALPQGLARTDGYSLLLLGAADGRRFGLKPEDLVVPAGSEIYLLRGLHVVAAPSDGKIRRGRGVFCLVSLRSGSLTGTRLHDCSSR
jgi:hypothetical protein